MSVKDKFVALLQMTVVFMLFRILEAILVAYSVVTLGRRTYSWSISDESPPQIYFIPFVLGLICIPKEIYDLYSRHEAGLREASLQRRRQLKDSQPVTQAQAPVKERPAIGDLVVALKAPVRPKLTIQIPPPETELEPTLKLQDLLPAKKPATPPQIETIKATLLPPFITATKKVRKSPSKTALPNKPVLQTEDELTIAKMERSDPIVKIDRCELPPVVAKPAVQPNKNSTKKRKFPKCLPCG
jgi:hypothetical protein